ncbi:serine/threonine protein kinase [Patescibacteria group bacterium]|nr:serine/threonine protein kinase [Patescibacteria group bacterium]
MTNRAGLIAYPQDFDNPRKGVRVKPPPLVDLYRLVRCIGHGTMGRVYEALDRYDDPVAVKLLAVEGTILNRHEHDLDAEWESVERFFKEVAIVSLLSKDTDRIPRYIDHGITQKDRVHYLVMELVDGETLERRLEHHSVDIVEALKIASEILRALEPAHALGIVHRDLKPANVMLVPGKGIKVLDFGVARAFHGNTDPRILVGNLAHMSPEQAEQRGITLEKNPRRLITPASDIFAVGSILYTMLTGRSFFAGITIEEIRQAHKETRITPYPAVNCDIPSSVWKILYHSLQHEPGKRMSAAAMRELIEAELRALVVTNDPLRKSSITSRYPNRPANDGEASKTLVTRFVR